MPAISVVIPTFNRVDSLARAVDSVLAQTVGDFEVIVVDDAPSETTARLVRDHPDERVRLVRHEENRGVAAARNTGIAAAAGSYIGFLDDDDVWLPAKLERQLRLIEERGADVVHTLVYVADGAGNVFEAASRRGFELFRKVAAAGYPYEWLLRRSSFFISTFLVRRECIERIGGFDEDLVAVEDLDFVHRLRREYELHLVDEPLVKHCFHGRNMSYGMDAGTWPRLAAKELVAGAGEPARQAQDRGVPTHAGRAERVDRLALRRRGSAGVPGTPFRPGRDLVANDREIPHCDVPPRLFVDGARSRARARRVPGEPDPWLDVP